MKVGPDITDFDLDPTPIYTDLRGYKWQILAKLDRPALIIQRVGLVGVIDPLEFMRLTIIPESPWAQETWSRTAAPDLKVVS